MKKTSLWLGILNVGQTFMLFKIMNQIKHKWLESSNCKYLHVFQPETAAINILNILILIFCLFFAHVHAMSRIEQ